MLTASELDNIFYVTHVKKASGDTLKRTSVGALLGGLLTGGYSYLTDIEEGTRRKVINALRKAIPGAAVGGGLGYLSSSNDSETVDRTTDTDSSGDVSSGGDVGNKSDPTGATDAAMNRLMDIPSEGSGLGTAGVILGLGLSRNPLTGIAIGGGAGVGLDSYLEGIREGSGSNIENHRDMVPDMVTGATAGYLLGNTMTGSVKDGGPLLRRFRRPKNIKSLFSGNPIPTSKGSVAATGLRNLLTIGLPVLAYNKGEKFADNLDAFLNYPGLE